VVRAPRRRFDLRRRGEDVGCGRGEAAHRCRLGFVGRGRVGAVRFRRLVHFGLIGSRGVGVLGMIGFGAIGLGVFGFFEL
jgi:hypothetical protein